jgi:hypothetical protein
MAAAKIGEPAMSTTTVGNFESSGLTFWRGCAVVCAALLAAAALCLLLLDMLGVSDIPNIVWTLPAALGLLFWAERMPTEARRVQSGWIGRTTALWSTQKSRSGSHEQFAKTCRRGLGVFGWFCMVCGALLTILWSIDWILDVSAFALHNEIRAELFTAPLHVFVGLSYLAFGAVAVESRRILSSRRP